MIYNKILGFLLKYKYVFTALVCSFLCITFLMNIFVEIIYTLLISLFISLGLLFLTYIILNHYNKIFTKEKFIVRIKSHIQPQIFQLKIPNTKHILFLNDGNHVYGLSIFKIASLPIGIQNYLQKFIRSMAANNINFFRVYTYQEVKKRYRSENNREFDQNYDYTYTFPTIDQDQMEQVHFDDDWRTEIMFGCYIELDKKLKEENLIEAATNLENIILIMKSIFDKTFAHVKFKILSGNSLYNVIESIPHGIRII
ncbi:MAG: hypothetical protein ACTSPY_02555 [Candidatus Helarchaeota archaeon]